MPSWTRLSTAACAQVMRAAKEAMISEFGQTPTQLLEEGQPHPPRAVITPPLTEPLPGYCGAPSAGEEVGQSLVHILMEAASAEPMQSVLASPSMAPPAAVAAAAPRATAPSGSGSDTGRSRSGSGQGNAAMPHAGAARPRRSSTGGAAVGAMRDHVMRVGSAVHGALRMGNLLSSFGSGHSHPAAVGAPAASDFEATALDSPRLGPAHGSQTDEGLETEAGPVLDTEEADCPLMAPPTGIAAPPSPVPLAQVLAHSASEANGSAGVTDELLQQFDDEADGLGEQGEARQDMLAAPQRVPQSRATEQGDTEEAARRQQQPSNADAQLAGAPAAAASTPLWPAHLHECLRVRCLLCKLCSDGSKSRIGNMPDLTRLSLHCTGHYALHGSCSAVQGHLAARMHTHLHAYVRFRLQATHTLTFPREDVTAVRIAHGCVVSGTSVGTLRAHTCADGALLHSTKLPRACPVSALAILPTSLPHAAPAATSADTGAAKQGGQSAYVLAASFSRVRAYSFAHGAALGEWEAHADEVCAMSWAGGGGGGDGDRGAARAPTDSMLYTASHDTTVKAWPVSGERWPWQAGTLPLFELDAPDASTPLCCEVRHSILHTRTAQHIRSELDHLLSRVHLAAAQQCTSLSRCDRQRDRDGGQSTGRLAYVSVTQHCARAGAHAHRCRAGGHRHRRVRRLRRAYGAAGVGGVDKSAHQCSRYCARA